MSEPHESRAWDELEAGHRAARPRGGGDAGEFPEHRPKAAVLACSDARVPPSVVFDQPAGSLFVVRLAGNAATPEAVASLDYAVGHLGVECVIVLGHTGCGAVAAALAGDTSPELAPIVAPLAHVVGPGTGVAAEDAVAVNVEHVVETLASGVGPTAEGVRSGTVRLRGAVHDLRTGELVELDVRPSTGDIAART